MWCLVHSVADTCVRYDVAPTGPAPRRHRAMATWLSLSACVWRRARKRREDPGSDLLSATWTVSVCSPCSGRGCSGRGSRGRVSQESPSDCVRARPGSSRPAVLCRPRRSGLHFALRPCFPAAAPPSGRTGARCPIGIPAWLSPSAASEGAAWWWDGRVRGEGAAWEPVQGRTGHTLALSRSLPAPRALCGDAVCVGDGGRGGCFGG